MSNELLERVTDEALDIRRIRLTTTGELRRVRVELSELQSETEQDISEAETLVGQLYSRIAEATALYDLVHDENKKLRDENTRLRRVLINLLAQI